MDSALNLLLFPRRHIAADGLRRALHCFGSDFQASQNLHLLAAMLEGCLLTHQRLHAAYAWGGLGIHDIQFHIGRKLALMTSRA